MSQYSFDNVSIHGFRGLRQLRLENLGRINLLVGENNCGKTSVLEAMSVLCSPCDPLEWLGVVRRRDFGRLDETRIQSLRWCFTQDGKLADPDVMFEGMCELSCEGRFPVQSLRVTYRDIVGERETGSQRPRPSEGDPDRDLSFELEPAHFDTRRGAEISHVFKSPTVMFDFSNAMQFWEGEALVARPPRTKAKYEHVANQTLTPYSHQVNPLQVMLQSRRILNEERQRVVELVQKFDPEVEGIEVASLRGERPGIYLRHRRLGAAPLSVFGDALRRAVLLASTAQSLKGGGLLLIDEVETGIHTTALERVFAWLTPLARELDVQVIATTHSLEAVDAVMASVGENVDDLATYHLEQREDQTRVRRIAGDVLHRLRFDRGMDVR